MSKELTDYISKARKSGLSDEKIAEELKNAGWENEAIQFHLISPPTPPHTSNKPNKKWIILLITIAVFGALFLGVKLYIEKSVEDVTNDIDYGEINIETNDETIPTTPPDQSHIDGDFSKKITPQVILDNPDNLLWQMLIPDEIKSMSDDRLVGLMCKKYEPGNQDGESYITAHNSDAITICDTENGERIAINETASGGGGGGANNFVQVGYLDENLSFMNPLEIRDTYINGYAQAYFGCYAGPLAFTIDENFYFSCGGGTIQVVFVAHLNDGSVEVIRKCYEAESPEGDVIQTCE